MRGRHCRRWRALAAVGAGLALPGCWLQPGFDASQTRWNPAEDEITPANVASLTEAWSVEMEAPEAFEPLVYGGRVFVGRQASESRGGGVLALDAASGELLWQHTTTPVGEYVSALPPTIVEGEVWSSWWQGFGEPGRCEFGTVRLDRDGTVVGEDHAGMPWSSPVQSGRYLVQLMFSECPPGHLPTPTLTVRDSRTLETLWTARANSVGSISGGQILTSEFYPLAGCGAPTCTSDVRAEQGSTTEQPLVARPGSDVFGVRGAFGAVNGEIFALSRASGGLLWRASIRSLDATLAVDDDHLYVATRSGGPWGGRLLVFDIDGCGARSCEPLWSAAVDPGGSSAWAPTVAGGLVYVAGNDNTIRAFPAGGCGRTVCDEIGHVTVDGLITSMSVAEGRLFVTSEDTPGRVQRLTVFEP
jgi:outer membrane protein assembly factor BamB